MSGVYYCNGVDDVETIGPNSNVGPYVFGGPAGDTSPPVCSVYGSVLPAVGAKIAADGANSGELRNLPVWANNAYITEPSGCGAFVQHMVEIPASYNGVTVCQPGDSGAPFMQHTPSNFNNVYAVADADVIEGSGCYGESIEQETADSNTYLMIVT